MPRTSSSYVAFTLNKRTLSLISFVIELANHKDEPTLDRTPTTCRGSRKVGLAKRPNTWSQNDGSEPREGVRAKTRDVFSY